MSIVPLPIRSHSHSDQVRSDTFQPNVLTRMVINYLQTGNKRVQNRIAQETEPFIRSLAAKFAPTVIDGSITYDDFICAGWKGFLAALRRYNPARKFQFLSYAHVRIQGAMLDERRARCFGYRRNKGKHFDDSSLPPLSLDELIVDSYEGTRQSSFLEMLSVASHESTVVHEAQEQEMIAIALWALMHIDPRRRFILLKHLVEERTLMTLSFELGISESRVCQLKHEGISLVRAIIQRHASLHPTMSGPVIVKDSNTMPNKLAGSSTTFTSIFSDSEWKFLEQLVSQAEL